MTDNLLYRLKNYAMHRLGFEWNHNIYSENNQEKIQRWKQFISDSDRRNIEIIEESIQRLLEQNSKYTLSLIAHGSSTYGKTNYSDIDLILEPTNGEIDMYRKLWDILKPSFEIFFQGGFWLNRDWVLEFNLAHLFNHQRNRKFIQIGYRTNIFKEEYANPLNGKKLVDILKRKKIPHVGIFLDNKRIS